MEVKSQEDQEELEREPTELDEKLTYGQEYYILNRDRLL